jgi:hypothetical protein
MVNSAPTIQAEQLRRIVEHLLAKTKAGQAHWSRKATDGEIPETSYELVLPQSRIVITYTRPRARPDFVNLQFINPDGILVDAWKVEEPDYDPDVEPIEQADPDGSWRLVSNLFFEIHRTVTGWDKVIRDVEAALASPGPIGRLANPETTSRK